MNRRSLLRLLTASAAALVLAAPAAAQPLEKIRFGFAQNAVSPIIISYVVPQHFGWYKEEGLDVEILTLGTNSAVMATLAQGRIEFGVGVPSFQLPLVAKGEKLPAINYFEYTYPFKWQVAVKPDSKAQRLQDLKGQVIGVSSFGVTDFPVGKALVRLVNMNPEKDVQWLAVGEGVTAGQALMRGAVAGLLYFDTGFGQIEAAGMNIRYLPLPNDVPKVGGLYISASREVLDKKRKQAIGFARAVAKGSLYTMENPEAAAYAFLQVYPEAGPRGGSIADKVKAVAVPVKKRAPLLTSYDKSVTDLGRISPAEWKDEVEFLGLEEAIKDPSSFYTNELIAEINKFDKDKVRSLARSFKVPAK